ncbi:MAG: DUF1307 domain-containing protein [Aerococcaceae bacterium]|nr:DUF1307 domain-containing protein [Aerococcaceae bacterium]
MKKLLSFISVLFVFVLAGCAAQITEHKYEADINGVRAEIVYKAQGDDVLEQVTTSKVKYSDIGMTKEQFEQFASSVAEVYKDVKGLEHTITSGEEEAVEVFKLDFKELDFDKAAEIEALGLDETAVKTKKISLEKSSEGIEALGFKEVK